MRGSRVPLIDPANVTDPIIASVFGEIERDLGFGIVPNVFCAMANQLAVLCASWDLFRAVVLKGELPRTLKEMVGIVVSAANQSEYALKVHMHSLGVQGVSFAVLQSLAGGASSATGLGPSANAILTYAHKAAHFGPLAISDEDVDAVLDEGVTPEDLNEVVAAIDLFRYVNGFTDLNRVPVDAI